VDSSKKAQSLWEGGVMERKERRHHTREFKVEAVRLAAVGDKTNPQRKLLGQRVDGKLLPLAEDRASMHCHYKTRDQARASLFDYMEVFYNRQRRHSTINYVAPLPFEESTSA
jgi:hypothetical protein